MFIHNKRLMYTVRVAEPNPGLATLMLEQFGGPQGELAAAMRYFTQALGEEDSGRKDMLLDIATEELSHLEIIGSIVAMLNRGAKGRMAEAALEEADLYLSLNARGESHTTSILYGGAPALVNSAGLPWTAAYVDSIGDPVCDLRSNIAAESRAKIVYERLINVTDDPGIKDALLFLMTREVAHQKSFEKALYAIEPSFPAGKIGGLPEFTDKYYDLSQGEGNTRGPWNEGDQWDYVDDEDEQAAVDGGDGSASVKLEPAEEAAVNAFALRTASDPNGNPVTGADLGAGPGSGRTTVLID
ncbi:MAG: manganese catalase family protein [Sphingobium sp.]